MQISNHTYENNGQSDTYIIYTYMHADMHAYTPTCMHVMHTHMADTDLLALQSSLVMCSGDRGLPSGSVPREEVLLLSLLGSLNPDIRQTYQAHSFDCLAKKPALPPEEFAEDFVLAKRCWASSSTFFDPCRTAAAPLFRACNSRHNSNASRGGGLQASVKVTARTLVSLNARGLAFSRLSQRIAVLLRKRPTKSLSFHATLRSRIERFPQKVSWKARPLAFLLFTYNEALSPPPMVDTKCRVCVLSSSKSGRPTIRTIRFSLS